MSRGGQRGKQGSTAALLWHKRRVMEAGRERGIPEDVLKKALNHRKGAEVRAMLVKLSR